ncbi:hypothetical protein [Nonomuraea sp. NPDC005650]|uniref:hypothetical protein n=1 Tax=Nonomuraea sp. NPDC005650 TaxID=3157045 RepID=UPI0033BEF71D
MGLRPWAYRTLAAIGASTAIAAGDDTMPLWARITLGTSSTLLAAVTAQPNTVAPRPPTSPTPNKKNEVSMVGWVPNCQIAPHAGTK